MLEREMLAFVIGYSSIDKVYCLTFVLSIHLFLIAHFTFRVTNQKFEVILNVIEK